jgi:hypothetical protein
MDSVTLSRRSLLQAIAATMATAIPLPWAEIVHAVDEAHVTAQAGESKTSFLSAGEAADIEAVASRSSFTDGGRRRESALHGQLLARRGSRRRGPRRRPPTRPLV